MTAAPRTNDMESASQLLLSTQLQNSPLDDSQKAFCSDPRRALRLLAPAGSGKTYSILWRCLNVLEASANDQRFLIFTFTRGARNELKERLLSDPAFRPIRGRTEILTLNSWGYRRMKSKMHGMRLCTSSKDRFFCVNNILRPIWLEYPRLRSILEGTKAKNRVYRDLMDFIDYLKSLGFRHDQYDDLSDLVNHLRWLEQHKMGAHVQHFRKRLSDLEVVELDNPNLEAVLEDAHEHFLKFWCEACLHLYRTSLATLEDQKYWALIDLDTLLEQGKFTTGMHRYHHILVDEFQDINVLDLNLLHVIARINKTELTIVGDDDQAIYEWRGASTSFILDPDDCISPGYQTHILKTNYRSPKNIVEFSQRLIKHNQKRVDKSIVANSTEDAKILAIQMPALTHSINFVLHIVRRSIADPSIKNVGIIGRKRSQIIPYQIVFASEGIQFYAAEDLQVLLSDAFRELKDMLAIIATAGSSDIRAADPVHDLLKLCGKVKRYPLNKTDYAMLRNHLFRAQPKSLVQAVHALCSYQGPLKGKNHDGQMAIKFATAIANFLDVDTVSEAINAISDNFDGLQRDYGKSLDDIFYADPPFLYMSEYAERYGADYQAFYNDTEKAIATLARIPTEDEEGRPDDAWKLPIHLMTALRAKGKEFDVVIILDANEKIWPIKYAETDDQLEQERRLFYVAFTRARKKLVILVNEVMLDEPAQPSPYLREMGLDILKHANNKSKDS